ncbi:MAG: putative membrane protein [Halioglobus sp.]|jgi:putative membrane protein
MKFLRKLLILLIVLLMAWVGGLFAIQNTAPVPLDLLVHTFEPKSLALWVLLAFALGGALGMAASSGILLRMRTSLGASKRKVERVNSELDKLRGEKTQADAP